MHKRNRHLAALALLAMGTALTACSSEPLRPDAVFYAPKTNAAQVEWRVERHPVSFPIGSERPAPGQLAQLDSFLGAYADDLSARVFLEANPAAVGRELAGRRYAVLDRHVAAQGITAEPIARDALAEQASADPSVANVYVGHFVVVPPSCPDWRKPTASDFTNTQSSNFGCATAVNFSQMLANPGDVVRGQRMGPADGARAAIPVRDYREGKKAGEQNGGGGATTGGGNGATTGGK